MLITKLAFRNLGRNARRSLITGLALAFSAALCIAYYALVDGMNAQLVHALTRFDLGHLQAHAEGYVAKRSVDLTLPEPEKVLSAVRADAAVRAAAPRVYAPALVGSERHSTGVQLVGVEPKSERQVTELHRQLVSGAYLDDDPTPWPEARKLTAEEKAADESLTRAETEAAEAEIDALAGSAEPATEPAPEAKKATDTQLERRLVRALSPRPQRPPNVVLGKSLARVLDVKVGDELFVSAQAVDGSAEGLRARVAGIFETGTTTYDRARIYMQIGDLQRLMHLDARIHEVAAVLASADEATAAATRIRGALGNDAGLDVRGWGALRPDIVRMLDLNRASSVLLAAIVFFVASLGVVNTMLMSVLERTREIGVLKAIGMSGASLFGMIVIETVFLALGGAVVGTGFGLLLDLYLVRQGIDLGFITRGVSFGGVGMQPVIRGDITMGGVLWPIAILTVVCVVAAVYPALRAAHMQPAVGMRET